MTAHSLNACCNVLHGHYFSPFGERSIRSLTARARVLVLVQDAVDLGGDRHVDAHLPGPFVDAAGGVHALGHHRHAGQDVGQLFALRQPFADVAIAAMPADAGRDQVAHAGQAR